MHRFFLTLSILLFYLNTYGNGIKGYVRTDNGEPLPFTTIYVKSIETGTTTNIEGYYEVKLPPGNYEVVFQFLGYETQVRQVAVTNEFVQLDIVLKTQVIVLQDIEVKAGKEDPAYTIMRKAIAKSKYHTQQIDEYKSKVYIKGAGRLKDSPFFLRKRLKKEGIDPKRVFISESVSEVHYKRPNTFNEKVISVRSSGDDNNTSPNDYVHGSFYEPEIAGAVSPLSPRAFSYYRFEYLGTFTDRGYAISKIRVTPRSKGDDVFRGIIQIVEDYWSIYTVDFSTVKLGIDFKIKQVYAPIEDKAWLPVSHKFEVDGSFLGFDFEYNYLATVSDYDITLNPDLDVELTVVDEKVEKELAEKLKETESIKSTNIQENLTSGKEVSRKNLNKLLREYEKEERKRQEEPEVISNRTFKIDSLAYKSDSTYWNQIRPVPLSEGEIRGYQINDSIAVVQRNEKNGDTLKVTKKGGFRLIDPIFGNTYKVGERAHFSITSIFNALHFNTVEGVNFNYNFNFTKTFKNKTWIKIGPTFHYAFARERLSGFLQMDLRHGDRSKGGNLSIKGGRYIRQYNRDNPIHPLVNTFTTLLLERNYMKILEHDFIALNYRKKITDKLTIRFSAELSERRELFNNTTGKLVDRDGEGYTPNAPVNEQLSDTSFPEHRATILNITGIYEPWKKYSIRNGRRSSIDGSSPIFSFLYRKGIENAFSSDVGFDQVEIGVRHGFDIGIRGNIQLKATAGTFFNKETMYFMDYKHFLGNLTPFLTTDPVGSFRLLDYYRYSTDDRYATVHLHYQFRKFLFTRIPIVRTLGVRENIIANFLATNSAMNYTELGYGINYIFRVFRIEAITSFRDGKYQDFGVRIGIATNLDNLFD
ncbi:DUF5686 and carboxypeptidase regulatory-like domain-containing protein [Fulvivirgaceae bacterium BMA10]|uniref:DUF5686 and carboxypeptidase regulatory-like domain-containing protein n=1 Tax=Splendidivirga corallicola TaxID=3051826 RepID=A0ABT8KVF0_9BACT|nr:DUF5686 and carboxypeptidase regulatory-like domain-containing protein [Fulvivirgaceae bacterium BMA10]